MPDNHVTVVATEVAPFVHVDERAMVLCDGRHTVVLDAARLRWASETLEVLADEGRATRTQHTHTLGGFRTPDDQVVLYAVSEQTAVSLSVSAEDFQTLRSRLPKRSA